MPAIIATRRAILSAPGPLLRRAEAYWLASRYAGAGPLLDLSGRGHDAAFPGGTNDPSFLPYTGARYLYLPGIVGNFASIAAATVPQITSDLDIRVHFLGAVPSTEQVLVSRYTGTAGSTSYLLDVTNIGTLRLYLSDGATIPSIQSSASIAALDRWVRATWRASDGRVQFFTSETYTPADGSGAWSQLGADRSLPLAGLAGAAATGVQIGGFGSFAIDARARRVQVFGSLSGSNKVLDVDFSGTYSADLTTLTAVTGQAVTINRSASGRKSVVVERPTFILGFDDYFEVADSDGLDFGVGEPFTHIALIRHFGTYPAHEMLWSKRDLTSATNPGYHIYIGQTSGQVAARIADGASTATALSGAAAAGALTHIAHRRRPGFLTALTGGVPGVDGPDATSSLASALALRFGRAAGGTSYFLGAEFYGGAIFRSALSDAEIARAATEILAL